MKRITISRNGKPLGEYDTGDIRGMVVTGEIVATDLARFEGDAEWKPLGKMPEFSGLFQPIPYTEELASTSLEDSPANESPDLSDTESPGLPIDPAPDRVEESQDEVKKQFMEEMTSGEFDALPIEEQEKPEDAEYWKDLGMTSEEFDALPIEEQENLEVKLGGKYCRQIIFRAGCFSAVMIFLIFLIAIMSACSKSPVVEVKPVEEKQQEVKTEEPVPETTPKLEGVSYEQLKRKGGLTYHNDPNIPYTGKTYVLYPSGEIQEAFKFKNGIIDGSSFSWHKNGQKKSQTNAKDGKFHGLQTYWYENGQKRIESTWKEFLRHGLETQWHENGQKKSEQNYKDGKNVEGSEKFWNSKGEPVDSLEEAAAE